MKELSCWEIMNCQGEDCPARKRPDMDCWEIVHEMEDYRAEFNICQDCLVYVLKTGTVMLSEQEVVDISNHKCALAEMRVTVQ